MLVAVGCPAGAFQPPRAVIEASRRSHKLCNGRPDGSTVGLRLASRQTDDDGSSAPPYSPSASASSTVIAVDVENVRGASSFRISHESLLHRAAAWRTSRGTGGASASSGGAAPAVYAAEGLAMVFDHGAARTAHSGGPLADGLAAVFAGPDRTADDVIVSLVGERCGAGTGVTGSSEGDVSGTVVAWAEEDGGGSGAGVARNATVVVTADAGLISRCQRARRESSTLSEVAFVEPASFLRELEVHASEAEERAFFGIVEKGRREKFSPSSDDEKEGSGGEGGSDVVQAETVEGSAGGNGNVDADGDASDENVDHDADLAFVKKEDADFALQRTVELQRRLLRDMNSKIGPPRRGKGNSGINARKGRGGGVISARKRSKLLATRHKANKKADMREAYKKRQSLAEKLRRKLAEAPGSRTAESVPIYRMLEWLSVPATGGGSWAENGVASVSAPRPLLTYSAGEDASAGEAGPLSSVLTVPLRDDDAEGSPDGVNGKSASASPSPPPLRMVVISDTHGFEKTLLKLPCPTADSEEGDDAAGVRPDYPVLPPADVLIHCGDFASNGSRARQRESIRKLDAFLASQRHIPEKIVVRGNHDPDTPGRVLFPKSKALYATSSKVLTVNGVKFALEPYSRKRAFGYPYSVGGGGAGGRGPTIPGCDVLVTHEPPRHVLDLTYSGMRAGSAWLRKAVERSESKPRCWLCGHIHEGRGAAKEMFVDGAATDGEAEGETTLVVNAANANYGKANRLVAGAVVVDVERKVGAGAADAATATTAAMHLDENETGDDPRVAIDGLGLELREMRPGVRRRKGLSGARKRAGRRRR